MIVVHGTRMFGKIEECGGQYIGTRFFHIYWMPIIPLGSTYVQTENDDGYQGFPLGLNLRSTFAAYARSWGTLAALGSAFAFLSMPSVDSAVFAAPLVGIAGWAWFKLGKVDAVGNAKRSVYLDVIGSFTDPAFLKDARAPLREVLIQKIADLRPGLISAGANGDRDVKYDTDSNDPDYLRPALALSRLDWSRANGPAKAELAATHDAVWAKLTSVETELVSPALA